MVAVPSYVSENAKRGLDLLEFAGSGLRPKTVREARSMAGGSVSANKVMRMAAWFARHETDLDTADADDYVAGRRDRPTAGQVAWLLWGGSLGKDRLQAMEWAQRKTEQLREEGELEAAAPSSLKQGGWVQYAVPKPPQSTTYATGKIIEIESDGTLTAGDESREGTSSNPAVMVQVFAVLEDDTLQETDRRVVRSASELRTIADPGDRVRKASASAQATLRNKVKDHNDKYGGTSSKRVNLRMLEAVFDRGVGAYRTNPGSVRPNVTSAEQWAFGRVNAFLQAVRTGRFPRTAFDRDLLPKGHPLSTR